MPQALKQISSPFAANSQPFWSVSEIHGNLRELCWGQIMGIYTYVVVRSPPSPFPPSLSSTKPRVQFPVLSPTLSNSIQLTSVSATLNSPKGFGPTPKKAKKSKKSRKNYDSEEEEDEEEEEEEGDSREEGVIPEIVTNRMMSRMAVSVGTPLFIGLLFFPFFYYLKVGLKIDVPSWVPVIVSFFFFGTALMGVSYGIVSASWDPLREGSFLGWNEAQKNWPVFWQSIFGGGSIFGAGSNKKKKKKKKK